MNNTDQNVSSIFQLSKEIDSNLEEAVKMCYEISKKYKDDLVSFPILIDLLDDALHSKKLLETAHSRILYSILKNSREMQSSFVKFFLPNVNCLIDTIDIPYPDKNRIDLTLKSNNFFLIVENKINKAGERASQIERYVNIAKRTYPIEQIYVLCLGGETNYSPTEVSLSEETRCILDDRLLCRSYRSDIVQWLTEIYEHVDFIGQPFLKSAILVYKTYLENKYNICNQYKDMNNKLDQTIIEYFSLESKSTKDKIRIIEDQIENTNKIEERLAALLKQFKESAVEEWFKQCSEELQGKVSLSVEDDELSFGFEFKYRNVIFWCGVSYYEEKPYWGIQGLKETMETKPRIFESLKNLILKSGNGFHNYEDNSEEWAVSDYENPEEIVRIYITLACLICDSEECEII